MSESTARHRGEAPANIRCGVLTISDTRTLETDQGGRIATRMLTDAGHRVEHRDLVPDEPTAIRDMIQRWTTEAPVEAVLITGGTGIAARDSTFETIAELLTKTLPGYGELFRMLSYEQIGPAAMLSRATGGLIGTTVVLTMPGSIAAVELAMNRLILPELGHLIHEMHK